MITAVLDARCGLSVGANDIYLNVAGGLRIVEPAADLAVAAALVSALTEIPVPTDTVVFGEIALSGRVRPVGARRCSAQGSRQARLLRGLGAGAPIGGAGASRAPSTGSRRCRSGI